MFSGGMACRVVPAMFSRVHGSRTAFPDYPERPSLIRMGLTVEGPRLRERAADALAATIVQRLDEQVPVEDRNQLALAL